MPRMMRTVIDNFDDNAIGAEWANSGCVIQNQRVEIPITTTAFDFKGMDWATPLNFNKTWYGVRFVDDGAAEASMDISPISAVVDATNSFYWFYNAGNLSCWTNVASSFMQRGSLLAYNPAVHVHLAVGINAAGQLDWMWSTDGIDFTSHTTLANPYGTTTASARMQAGRNAAAGTPQTIIYDDFSRWVIALSHKSNFLSKMRRR